MLNNQPLFQPILSKIHVNESMNKPEAYLALFLWWRSLLYRNQSTDPQNKLMGWFLYDRDFRHERVKTMPNINDVVLRK